MRVSVLAAGLICCCASAAMAVTIATPVASVRRTLGAATILVTMTGRTTGSSRGPVRESRRAVSLAAGRCYLFVGAATGAGTVTAAIEASGATRASLALPASGAVDQRTLCPSKSKSADVIVRETGSVSYSVCLAARP